MGNNCHFKQLTSLKNVGPDYHTPYFLLATASEFCCSMKLTISIAYHRFTIITCLWYSAHLSCPVGSQGLGKAWSLASKDQCWSQLNALNEPVDVTSADTV